MRRHGFEQLTRACYRERQDKPVRLRQGQCALGGRDGSALIAEFAMRERRQQICLDDGHITDGWRLVFVPLALVALYKVAEQDSGVASSLLNTAQQVGGAIGLALLGTVAWTAVANSVRTQVAAAAAGGPGQSKAAKAGQPLPKPGTPPPVSIYNHALTVGFSGAFEVAAGIALLALLIAIATIRVRRQELAGAAPEPQQAAPQPAAPQRTAVQPAAPQPGIVHEDRAVLAAAVRPCRLC
jgi:hypothetical protein